MKTCCAVLALIAFFAPLVRGELVSFPEHNFSVEVPAGWSAIKPRISEALTAVQSPNNSSRFLAFAAKHPPHERATAAADMREGCKQSLAEQGCRFDPEEQMTIGSQPFVSFITHFPAGQTLTAYSTTAGGEMYMLQAIQGAGAPNDLELETIIQSFRLLTAAEAGPLNTPSKSAAYRAGELFGRFLVFGTVAGGLIVVGVVLWLAFRRS